MIDSSSEPNYEPPSKTAKRDEQKFHVEVALYHLRKLSADILPPAVVPYYIATMAVAEKMNNELNERTSPEDIVCPTFMADTMTDSICIHCGFSRDEHPISRTKLDARNKEAVVASKLHSNSMLPMTWLA